MLKKNSLQRVKSHMVHINIWSDIYVVYLESYLLPSYPF